MNTPSPHDLTQLKPSSGARAAYGRLRKAQRTTPFPSVAERQDWLERLERVVLEHAERFVAAIDADFGGRARAETLLVEIMATLESVRDARRHVARWVGRRPRQPSPYFQPGRAWVEPLPLGVVGIIAPWNYPVNLLLAPLVGALAAGNRVLLKPSELTPRTSELLGEALRGRFAADELAVLEGGPDVAAELTRLPLDHLFFTGSTAVGRRVSLAAAENLVPVTLELGGKSPAWIHPDYSIARAAERIALGKLFNAGQTCIAPDYVLVAEGREAEFGAEFAAAALRAYPDLPTTHDYSAIVTGRHRERLAALLVDATSHGARLQQVGPTPAPASPKMAPVLVFGATDEMKVMQEELFGPILPVISYATPEQARERIVSAPKPLAFYYFDDDMRRAAEVLRSVPSGGACLNDTLNHFAQESLPFGGVGASGTGAYHGVWGFERFSHLRGVLEASALAPVRPLQTPPYGRVLDVALALLMGGPVGDASRRLLKAARARAAD